MDNLTHSFVGIIAAKAGLERLSPGAPALCLLAANSPDADLVVLAFGDRWTFLQHHRGITHAIVGVLVLALFLPLLFYGGDRLLSRLRNRSPTTNLKGLLIVSLIVSATHPLLDWTNNYGIRLLLPWNERWFYGDLVFIVDPYLWLVLGGASFLLTARTRVLKFVWGILAILLTLLMVASPRGGGLPNPSLITSIWIAGMVCLTVLFIRDAGRRWGNRIPFAVIAMVICYWTMLAFAHSRALVRGSEEAARMATPGGETVTRLVAMPRLANPFRWDCVFETERATYRFDVGVLTTASINPPVRYPKPSTELLRLVDPVVQQRPARIFLNFARFPVTQLEDPGCATRTLVQFADLRYTEPGRSRGNFSLELPVDCPSDLKE